MGFGLDWIGLSRVTDNSSSWPCSFAPKVNLPPSKGSRCVVDLSSTEQFLWQFPCGAPKKQDTRTQDNALAFTNSQTYLNKRGSNSKDEKEPQNKPPQTIGVISSVYRVPQKNHGLHHDSSGSGSSPSSSLYSSCIN